MITTAIRLHLGCGDLYREGFVNIDLRDDCKTDIKCDVRALPFDAGEVSDIVAEDLLEHFPATQTDTLLREWARVLHPGGTLTIKCPNMLALARKIILYTENEQHDQAALIIRNVYGGHRWGPDGSLDAHHTGWTPQLLTRLLNEHGFVVQSMDSELNFTSVAVKL